MAGTVRELQARFTGAFGGLRQTIRGVQREIQGISSITRRTVRDSNREFGRMEDVMERLPEHLQGFGRELQTTRQEMKRTAREGTRSLDEMADAATKSSVAMSKMTSVTKSGKSAIKTIQGLNDAAKETQLAILGLNRNGTVKISTEETTRRLAQFKDELADSKRQLEALRDAGDFGSYEAGMRVVEQKLKDVDRAMYAAAQGGQAYTNMINRLGVNTSDAANQAAIQMEAYKDQFIRSVDLMNAKSNQSKKMMDILPEVSHFQSADRFFLGIGNRLEDIAKKGSAASIALRMLGRDASMKDLNDRIMLINQGLMRMNMLGMGMGIAFGGFTVGMIKLSNAVDGRLVPAAEKFKDTWGEALTPFAKIWTDFALLVVNAGTKVGEFVQKINELNPAITEMAGMFMYLFTGLSVILAPMAIGIGRAEGMRAAFSSMFMMVKPFVLGFLRIAATASIVAGAMVVVGGVFIKLWKNSENLRAAIMSLWRTLQEAGNTIAAPFIKAFQMIGSEVTKLLNKMVGSDAQNMASFWQTIGDKIAVGINKIRDVIQPVAEKIASVVDAFVEWEGFLPVIAGLTAAFVTYKATVVGVAAAVKAWNLIQKASVATMALMRGAMIAYTVAGGGLQGILAVVTAGQRALNLSMMMNPIGLIIAALVGLGVALVVAYKKSETFRNIVDAMGKALKDSFKATIDWFTTTLPQWVSNTVKWFGDLKNKAVGKFSELKQETINRFNEIKAFFVQWGPLMLAALGGPLGLAVYAFVKNWNSIKSSTISIFTAVKDAIVNALNTAKDITIRIIQGYVNNVKNNWNSLKSATVSIYNATKDFIVKLWNSVSSFVQKVASNIYNRFKSNWQQTLDTTRSIFNSIKSFFTSIWNSLVKFLSNSANSIKNNVVKSWNSLKTQTVQLFSNIKSSVSKIFDDIVSGAKKLPGRIGDGIKSMASKVKNGVSEIGKKLAGGLESVINAITQKGINVVLDKIGVDEKNQIPELNIPGYKKGTGAHPGGLFIAGDGGEEELIRFPDGSMTLSPAKDTLYHGDKGTEVFNGKQTKSILDAAIPKYETGNTTRTSAKSMEKSAEESAHKALHGTKKAAGKAKDIIGDVWSYVEDPKKLMTKVFDSLNLKMPDVGGMMGQLAKSGVTKIKDGAVNFIKSKMDEFMPSFGADGDSGTPGPGSGYGGMRTYVEAWYNKVKDKFGPTRFMGGYANRNMVGGSSKSMHAYGRAFDIGGSGATMSKIAEYLRTTASNLQYVIYNHRIAGPGKGKGWRPYGGGGKNPHTDHVHADFYPPAGEGGGGYSGKVSGKLSNWIDQAMKMRGVSGSEWKNGLNWIIQKESTGNPRAVGAMTSDGQAKGLMQLKHFNYKGDPFNPVNNIYWGIKYIKDRYKSIGGALSWWRSHNWYANGTKGHKGGSAVMGDAGKREPFLLPNGLMGLSPAISTLFQDLPKGTVVWKSVQDFMGQLNNGASSILGSNMPSVDLSGISSAGVGSTTTNNYTLKDIQNALTVDVSVQMGDVIMDGRKVAQVTSPYIKKDLVKDIKKDSYKRGMK